MPEFKCPRCEKCLSSKRALQQHLNKKKPCVSGASKTKYRCSRCLVYLSTKQKLTQHMKRKNPCEVYRHIPVVKTDLVKQMELEEGKEKMINEMKAEYRRELIKIYKKFGDNVYIASRHKLILEKKLKDNIKKVNNRKTLPDKMPSVIPDKKTQVDTVENLLKRYKQLKRRVEKAEKRFSELEDEHEDSMIGMTSILNATYDDRTALLKIKKELKRQIGRNSRRVIANAEEDLKEE